MKGDVLKRAREGSVQKDSHAAVEFLTDIMLLLERHTQGRYAEEGFPAIRVEQQGKIRLDDEDVRELICFLFYVLLNHPDRAWAAAWALGKCYGHDIVEGVCQGIELYWQKDDQTCFYLIKAISDSHQMNELSPRVMTLFRIVGKEGLPQSRQFLASLFSLIKE
jgi:hypothetical protein